MRKRVINNIADTIFWYILYFLPVLAYLMFVISAPFKDIQVEEGSSVEYEVQKVCTAPAGTELLFDGVPDSFNSGSILMLFSFSSSESGDVESMFFSSFLVFDFAEPLSVPVAFAPYSVFFVDSASSNVLQLPLDFSFVVPVDFVFNNDFILSSDGQEFILSLESCIFSEQYIYSDIPKPDLITYDFKDFVNSMGFEFATDNIIVNSLSDIFGTGGIMPMFDNDTPFIIFAWFIGVYLLHLLVDFLLFIPRIAHKWMKDCTGGD